MRADRLIAAALVVLVSTAIVGFSAGTTGASFTGTTTNPNQSWQTSNVVAPASTSTTTAAAGAVTLSWPATTTPANGHTVTYLVFRGATQVCSTSLLTCSDTPPADGTNSYSVQTKIAQGAGFFTSGNSPAQNGLSDRTAPAMSITCGGGACGGWRNGAVVVTGTDAGSGMKSVTYNINSGANVVTNSNTVSFTPADGSYTINYFGTDVAGNVAGTTAQAIKIDNTGPTVATGLSGMSFSAGSIVAWWTASTDASSGLAGYTAHRTNAVTTCPATLNVANFPVAVASSGTTAAVNFTGLTSTKKYCYYVTATDAAGNSSNSAASALITSN